MAKQTPFGFSKLAQESLLTQEKPAKISKKQQSLQIGLPMERSMQENRVALTPDSVGLIVANGHEIVVETGAGLSSNFSDDEYANAGAKVAYSSEEVFECPVVLKVEPATIEELDMMKPQSTLISAIHLGTMSSAYLKKIKQKRLTALGFELLEDKSGGMPVVRAMSEIAGMNALFIASEYLSNVRNGRGVILGGITGVAPTNIVILGAGTVAEYAARVAFALGARVQIFDNQIYKLRRLKSALGHNIATSTIDTETLRTALRSADVVIGAIRPEKGRNRYFVTEEMVGSMKPNSVIVDITIDQGGCFETSRPTTHESPTFRKFEVIHYCVPNIPSRVGRTATTALSNIFTPIILKAGDHGGVEEMMFMEEWFLKAVYSYKGCLSNEAIANKFDMEFKDLNLFAPPSME
ncbi:MULTISPECIES: alanine dehydrogenase [Persicobacter]|uniref:alanine dehydrogenase n=1 Tax=Persicobacter diffluens TaxID=981 RepID=A0AAN4VZC0_9BACT|nr:alanine dehydrogenase [Persicobacter sp. CCB-QB2]GJM61590.1 alanine dehydrogenase [Persicobacter diffluens]